MTTTCDNCRPWCATTRNQLDSRLRRIVTNPHVIAHVCPKCGSSAWATTGEFVKDEEVDARLTPRRTKHRVTATVTLVALVIALVMFLQRS